MTGSGPPLVRPSRPYGNVRAWRSRISSWSGTSPGGSLPLPTCCAPAIPSRSRWASCLPWPIPRPSGCGRTCGSATPNRSATRCCAPRSPAATRQSIPTRCWCARAHRRPSSSRSAPCSVRATTRWWCGPATRPSGSCCCRGRSSAIPATTSASVSAAATSRTRWRPSRASPPTAPALLPRDRRRAGSLAEQSSARTREVCSGREHGPGAGRPGPVGGPRPDRAGEGRAGAAARARRGAGRPARAGALQPRRLHDRGRLLAGGLPPGPGAGGRVPGDRRAARPGGGASRVGHRAGRGVDAHGRRAGARHHQDGQGPGGPPRGPARGVTSGHVLAVELALPGGELVRLGAEGPEAPGYDLRGLVVGSEGTLGIVTAICVRLTPIAPAVRTMLLDFPTVADAAATVAGVVAAGVVPAAMELLDRRILEVIEPYVHAGYPTDADAVLLVEVDGLPGGVAAEAAVIERVARRHRVGSIQVARDEAQRARLWKGRKSALGAVSRIAPHYYLHDTVVPRGRLTEVLARVYEITGRYDLTGVDRLVDYHAEEMLAVVEAGMRCGRLDQVLAEQGQEWPVDAPERATVGGVIAAAASSPRRLAVGPVRDLVLEVELVTGDGRRVRAGGRTVKNVRGYDLCGLVTGSLGTLGVIVQVALKLRPLPRARRTIVATGGPRRAAELLRAVPLATAALVTPDGVELRLEGWPTDVEEQTDRAVALLGAEAGVRDDVPFPAERVLLEAPVVVEAAVAPSRLPALVEAIEALADGRAGRPGWAALAGVGACWIGLGEAGGPLERLRTVVAELGGIAPVVRGPGGHRLVRGLRAVPAALPDLPAHRRGVRVAARAYRRHARRLRGPGRGGRALHGVHGPVPFVPCLRGRVPLARALRPHDGAGPLPGRAVAAGAAPPGALARPGGRATARLAAHPGDGAAAAGQAAATRPRPRAAPPRAAA